VLLLRARRAQPPQSTTRPGSTLPPRIWAKGVGRGGSPASKRTAAIPSSPSHGCVDACARVNLVDPVMEQDGKVDAGSDAVASAPSTAPAEHHPPRLHTSPPNLGKRSREDALSPSTGQTPPTIRRFTAGHINPAANVLLTPPSSEPEAARARGCRHHPGCQRRGSAQSRF
jgi:hypothetical protein